MVWLCLIWLAAADPLVEASADWAIDPSARGAVEDAVALLQGGDFEEAGRALGALDDASTAPQISYLHALAWYQAGDLVRAQEAAFATSDGTYAPLLNLRGLVLGDLGRGEEALTLLAQALVAAGDDVALQGRIRLNEGLVQADAGAFAEAQRALADAAALGEASGDATVTQGAADNLARIASLTGEGGARDVLGAVVEQLRRGDVDEAKHVLSGAQGEDHRVVARRTLAEAAIARVEGRPTDALALAQRALDEARANGLVRERLAALGDIAALYVSLDQPDAARTQLEEALAVVDGSSFRVREVGLRLQAGLLAADGADLERASAMADAARDLLQGSPQPVAQARLAELRGRIAAGQGDAASAQAHFLDSYEAVNALGYAADAARVATEAVRRTGDATAREAWRTRAQDSFAAAHEPSGDAFVAISEGLALADAGDVEAALAAFVRAAMAADQAGTRGERVAATARANASAALRSFGYSDAHAASAVTEGLAEVAGDLAAFHEAEAAYARGREAYNSEHFDDAAVALRHARAGFEAVDEPSLAGSSRSALAWATYQAAVRADPAAPSAAFDAIEIEADALGDAELGVRSRAAGALARARAGDLAGLRDAADACDAMDLTVLAGRLLAEIALAENADLADRVEAAVAARARLAGQDLGDHVLYAVAVSAYNAENYPVAREVITPLIGEPSAVAEAVAQLVVALDQVTAGP